MVEETAGGRSSALKGSEGLVRNRELFEKFNRTRYRNVYQTFPDNYFLIFKVVPFLLHTNFRGLPGFVDHPETPCGVKCYMPDDETAVLINDYFSKKCKFKPRENLNEGFVEFLSVMGSVGSIAQTSRSDFDMWVGVHRDSVSQEAFRRFQEKLRDIEAWLMKLRLEVHFFPTDIHSVKSNVFGSVDDESCGSAQALMLKDEFYRTAILITGKIPYWWIVEPGVADGEYASRYEKYTAADPAFAEQYVDIGDVGKIDKAEFFGAALWQLVKSLQSPFKSFIKMCLIEKYLYAGNEDRVSLLSNTLKENVILNQNMDSQATDAYLLMFKTVEDYFLQAGKTKEAEILRTCFYMKVQPNLSGLNKYAKYDGDKRSLMGRYTQDWKWDADRLKRLDTFYRWSMEDLLKFDQELKMYMVHSFQTLSKSRDLLGGQSLISEDDLKIISRKLLSYYMPKPKKVKHFVFSFDDNVHEPELSVARQDIWRLYRGEVSRDAHRVVFNNLLYASNHVTDICLWTAYSRIFSRTGTKLNVFPGETHVSQSDISQLVASITDNLTGHASAKSKNYLSEPFVQNAFVTCRFDPSNAEDRISVFYMNSWKELFAEHFAREEDFYPIFADILSGYIRSGMPNPLGFVTFHSASGGMKDMLEMKRRVIDALTAFRKFHRPKKSVGVYVLAVERGFLAAVADDAAVRIFSHENIYALVAILGREITSLQPRMYFFDDAAAKTSFLAAAAQKFEPGAFQVFVSKVNESLTFVLFADELNRMSADLVPAVSAANELKGVHAFVTGVDPARKLNFYEITPTRAEPLITQMTIDGISATASTCPVWPVRAVQNESAAAITPELDGFTFEIDTKAYTLSDTAQKAQFIDHYRKTSNGGVPPTVQIAQIVPNKTTDLSDLVRVKLSLQKKLRDLIRPA